jgi:magnesium transporter
MIAESALVGDFLEQHPFEVATILESAAEEDAVAVLSPFPVTLAAGALERVDALYGAGCLLRWPGDSVGALLAALPAGAASRMLRTLDRVERERLLGTVEASAREALERTLRYPAGTAGALMEPSVLSLPEEIAAGEAQRRIRQRARYVRDHVWLVDASQKLTGVLDLRDLVMASDERLLGEIAQPVETKLPAETPVDEIELHPGWRRLDVLPVVDRDERLVGVLRREALTPAEPPRVAAVAGPAAVGVGVAHLFWTMGGALLDPLFSGSSTSRTDRESTGES